jgi:ABC-type multidrug transport system ATPase subunit
VLGSAEPEALGREGGAVLASSTPDALWRAPTARAVQPAAIRCQDVSHGRLLDRCSFRLAPGVRLLLVAEPDDAGSLLLRILAGLVRPASGRVSVAGLGDPDDARHGGRMAYVGAAPGIHSWMTPREALELGTSVLDLEPSTAARRIRDALAHVGIEPADAARPLRRGGAALAQRTALAAGLVADPEVLLLDEPLAALAPVVRARLLAVPGPRRSIVVSTRRPADLAGIATHVMLLRGGRVSLLAGIGELEAAGLPPTREGIAALADRQARARA